MKDFFKLLIFWACRAFFSLFSICPIRKNRVTFVSYKGAQYSCNPKAVSEYLLTHCKDQFEVVWGLDDPATYDGIRDERVTVVKHGTLKFYKLLCTSRFIITNVDYLSYIRFRKEQYIIQTWHGGGSYKKVGAQTKNINYFTAKRRSYFNARTDAFISSSAIFTRDTIQGSFHFQGQILDYGMPRNDLLFTKDPEKAAQIKKRLGLSEEQHILLYAPTYRQIIKYTDYELDESRLKTALQNRFGGEWVILYRLHPMLKDTFDAASHDVMDVSHYNDMQELLFVSDILITDYSSSMWDFSLTHRPCFLFATDLRSYQNERDFYTDIHSWPFILTENNDELAEKIAAFDEEHYVNDVIAYHEASGSYETGSACRKVAELMRSKL